ncbi:sialic acid-binding Ig-like lectin 14 [Channa argus]|uniref:sialic acid-binding Ig-like lectin 14 n=1 Tax=Channa argus TaxID=215402 RepID=UPI00351FC6AC
MPASTDTREITNKSMLSRGWSFTTPSSITGMRGSCIIIPCSFTYSTSQPADLRIIWYLYRSNEYPAVYDQRQAVITKFDGITSLIESVGERNCSLKINKLNMSRNQDRLYPWVDVNPITSYHTLGSQIYEKTTQLIVSDRAQQPQLSIISIPRVGEQSRVSCSVQHTCVSAPPTLTLNGTNGDDVTVDTLVSDGIWQRTVERTWIIKETDRSVECTVSYSGGQSARSELRLNVESPPEKNVMTSVPAEVDAGSTFSVSCAVMHTYPLHPPVFSCSVQNLTSEVVHTQMTQGLWETTSTITFMVPVGDGVKTLNCSATFWRNKEQVRTVKLNVKG